MTSKFLVSELMMHQEVWDQIWDHSLCLGMWFSFGNVVQNWECDQIWEHDS